MTAQASDAAKAHICLTSLAELQPLASCNTPCETPSTTIASANAPQSMEHTVNNNNNNMNNSNNCMSSSMLLNPTITTSTTTTAVNDASLTCCMSSTPSLMHGVHSSLSTPTLRATPVSNESQAQCVNSTHTCGSPVTIMAATPIPRWPGQAETGLGNKDKNVHASLVTQCHGQKHTHADMAVRRLERALERQTSANGPRSPRGGGRGLGRRRASEAVLVAHALQLSK